MLPQRAARRPILLYFGSSPFFSSNTWYVVDLWCFKTHESDKSSSFSELSVTLQSKPVSTADSNICHWKPTMQYSVNYSSQMDIMPLTITNDCLSLSETETVNHTLALVELSDWYQLIGQPWFPQSWLVVGPKFPDRNKSICNQCEWKFDSFVFFPYV